MATAVAKAAVRPSVPVRRRNRRREDRQVDVQVGRVREGALGPSSADVAEASGSRRPESATRARDLAMQRSGASQKCAGEALNWSRQTLHEPKHSSCNRTGKIESVVMRRRAQSPSGKGWLCELGVWSQKWSHADL